MTVLNRFFKKGRHQMTIKRARVEAPTPKVGHVPAPPARLVVLGLLFALALAGPIWTARATAAVTAQAPNVIIFLTDDQGLGFLDAMPTVRSRLTARGTTFPHAVVPTSLCCPSRAALLTGLYSHTTSVYDTAGSFGGWKTFQPWEDQTIAVALNQAGYRTGLFGKYMNGWSSAMQQGLATVPPGWDVFSAMSSDDGGDGAYYQYSLLGTEATRHYESTPADYSTDVLGGQAAAFLQESPVDQPFLLYFAPYGPHFPHTPAPRDVGTGSADPLNAAALESDLRDKPRWVRKNDAEPHAKVIREIQQQHEALMSVDDAVAKIMDAVGYARMENTLVIFTSDNGLMNGEHGLNGKYTPYSGATEVPLIVRWDGHVASGATDLRLMTPEGLTATIADAAGVQMQTEGSGLADPAIKGTVLEAVANDKHSAYCGYRTQRFMFAEYDGHGRELYDYRRDPYELTNKAFRARYADVVGRSRQLAIQQCVPRPPGFTW